MKINPLSSPDWSEVTNRERNQVVFEHLNKSYGAYEIRTNYDTSLLKAFSALTVLITISSVCIIISVYFNPVMTEVPIPDDSPLLKTLVIEVPIIPEEPKKNIKAITPVTKQYTEPKITDDPETDPDEIEPDKPSSNLSMSGDSGNSDLPLISANNDPDNYRDRGKITDENTDEPYDFVQVMPRFPGGDKELYRFIRKNIIYPEALRGMGAKGKIGILFIVDRDGQLKNISVYQGTKYSELNNEVLRVVNKMPKWEPGTQNGKPVRVKLILPIRFDLN